MIGMMREAIKIQNLRTCPPDGGYMDKRYLAGLFDGEGCVMIRRMALKSGFTQYAMIVAITNSYLPILTELREIYGGSVNFARSQSQTDKCFRWTACANIGLRFLQDISRYVIIKKEEVVGAIEFQTSKEFKYVIGEEYRNRLSSLKKRRFKLCPTAA